MFRERLKARGRRPVCNVALGSVTCLWTILGLACGGNVLTAGPDAADNTDVAADAAVDALGTDSGQDAACLIRDTDYDRTCSVDSDCVIAVGGQPVVFGDYCQPLCFCTAGTISRAAAAQFAANVSKTPIGSGALQGLNCGCLGGLGACCQHNQCTFPCSYDSSDAGPLEVDDATAGEPIPDGSVLCSRESGPIDGAAMDAGAVRWCTPPNRCTPYNGEWACCANISNGTAVCLAIGSGDQ